MALLDTNPAKVEDSVCWTRTPEIQMVAYDETPFVSVVTRNTTVARRVYEWACDDSGGDDADLLAHRAAYEVGWYLLIEAVREIAPGAPTGIWRETYGWTTESTT
jgi:hypothetical protein